MPQKLFHVVVAIDETKIWRLRQLADKLITFQLFVCFKKKNNSIYSYDLFFNEYNPSWSTSFLQREGIQSVFL